MDDSEEVTGVIVSQRKMETRVHIWTKHCEKEVMERLGKQWKALLGGEAQLAFQNHHEGKDIYFV